MKWYRCVMLASISCCILPVVAAFSQSTPDCQLIAQFGSPSQPNVHSSQQRTVPNVLGMPFPMAKQMLESAGFVVRSNDGFAGANVKTVKEQDPKPNQLAIPGAPVWLTLN